MMSLFTTTLFALVTSAHASPPDLEAIEMKAIFALGGPKGCHRMQVDSTQSASVPVLGSDEEVVRMTGQLSSGTWKNLDVRMVSDTDPSERIFDDGPLLLGEPGMGTVPGSKASADDRALLEALLTPAAELRWKNGRIERRTDGLGWASYVDVKDGRASGFGLSVKGDEALDWHITWDAKGVPVRETTHATFGAMGVTVTVDQSLAYTALGACGG